MHQLWFKPLIRLANRYIQNSSVISSRHLASLKSSECPGKAKILMDPKCKVAFITGGAEGIGFATAQALLSRGAKAVVLAGNDFSAGQQAVNVLNCAFGKKKALFLKTNVSDKRELRDAFKATLKEYDELDIIINSAGTFNEKEYPETLRTNILGTLYSTELGYKLLKKKKAGHDGIIINLCGLNGLEPSVGAPTETCCSHAIVGFSRSVGDPANYQRTRVRVIVLCVGYTKTGYYKDALKNSLNEYLSNLLKGEIRQAKRQNADVCGKAIVQIIKYATTGCVFVCNSSNLYTINMPKWKPNSTLVSQFI